MRGLICAVLFLTLAGAGIADAKRPLPALTVSSAQGEEAGVASFVVRLSQPSRKSVKVRYATSDGTATAGSDYQAVSGTLTFRTGERSKRISVRVADDATPEDEETFYLDLSKPKNARLKVPEGRAKIAPSDLPASFTVTATLTSGSGGGAGKATLTLDPSTETASFTLTLVDSPEDPSAGHIHSARDQSLGITVAPLPARNGTSTGTIPIARKVIVGIYTSPNDYDIQIHTPTTAYTLDGRLART